MTREDLRRIVEGITDEQLRAILDINTADIGKAKQDYDSVKSENEALQGKITALSEKASSAEEYKQKLEALNNEIQKEKDAKKAEAEDRALTEAIEAVFGDAKFTSDYVRAGLIADMKSEIAKPENRGKGYSEIYEALTKDKPGIFENPNPPANMHGFGNVEPNVSENAMRAVMGLAPNKE